MDRGEAKAILSCIDRLTAVKSGSDRLQIEDIKRLLQTFTCSSLSEIRSSEEKSYYQPEMEIRMSNGRRIMIQGNPDSNEIYLYSRYRGDVKDILSVRDVSDDSAPDKYDISLYGNDINVENSL